MGPTHASKTMLPSIPKIISNKPWLLVALLFGLFLTGWTFFFIIAFQNAPQRVPLAVPVNHAGH